jgi:predicted ATP-grasp superfamily ATP-dependent carboligase
MLDRGDHVVIAGVSTRALARSAARAGYRVTAIDAFGDRDLRAVATVVALTRQSGGFSADDAAEAAVSLQADAVAYTSNFENFPEAVARLASASRLLGNPSPILRAVRNPLFLMRTLRSRGLPAPSTRASAPARGQRTSAWLLKPRRSGGGHGTRVWRGGAVPRQAYLQQRIRGVPGSVIFLADGRRAQPLGVTRQLVGERAFGAAGFRYCGSLLALGHVALFENEARLRAAAWELAQVVTEEFGLVGLNGVDFIGRDGIPWPIEVNPRPCGSMELVERAGGPSLFQLHARACAGELPRAPVGGIGVGRVLGKAVVFARRDVTVDASSGSVLAGAADLPHVGERIGRGHPICTVFAEARDATTCIRRLAASAHAVHAALEPRRHRAGAA